MGLPVERERATEVKLGARWRGARQHEAVAWRDPAHRRHIGGVADRGQVEACADDRALEAGKREHACLKTFAAAGGAAPALLADRHRLEDGDGRNHRDHRRDHQLEQRETCRAGARGEALVARHPGHDCGSRIIAVVV